LHPGKPSGDGFGGAVGPAVEDQHLDLVAGGLGFQLLQALQEAVLAVDRGDHDREARRHP